MNNVNLSPAQLMDIARRVCTEKQLEVVRLHDNGMGWKRISLMLGVSTDTVRSHHKAAIHKITKEVTRVQALGCGATGSAGEGAREDGGGGAA